jgi:hypothetical protein
MYHSRRWITAAIAILVSLAVTDARAQIVGTSGTVDPVPLIREDPGPLGSRDVFWGIGAPNRVPQAPFQFIEENTNGTQPKIVVRDAAGATWVVKFGTEVHAEVASNRLVYAVGYYTEELYFVPSGRIEGAVALQRARDHIDAAGTFANARFARRDPNVTATKEEWTFRENPFVGQKELSGLLILMTMLNNWDIRGAANNEVFEVTTPDGRKEHRYLVGDLGATFGRMGGRLSGRSKWQLDDYRSEGFIEKVENGVLHLDYDGFDSGMDRVPLEHARWFVAIVSQLSPEQVRRAFDAAGAAPEHAEGFSRRFMEKIAELQAVVK